MITDQQNTYCGMIANYIYSDMNICPESLTSQNVMDAMKALYFHGYTIGEFTMQDRSIRMDLFNRIVEHAFQIDANENPE